LFEQEVTTLQLGIELITLAPLMLAASSWFELLLSAGHRVIPESFGKDEYIYPVYLDSEARIAATGRKCLFLNHQNLNGYQTGPAELVQVQPVEPNTHLFLFLSSSLSLTRNRLAEEFALSIVTACAQSRVPLVENAIESSGSGKFVIDLSALPASAVLASSF
jgi:hypothetical protein